MSVAETQYFALLRSALWNTPVTIEEEVEWDAVMKLAKHHATNVLLSDVASQMVGNNCPPASVISEMQSAMRFNLINHMKLKQILVSVVRLLQEHNIEPVLLKGFSIAMLYPNPNLRQFGDIDLFVGLDDFHEACKLVRTLPGSYNWREEMDAGKHYNIEFGQYPLEIHRVSADLSGHKELAAYESIEQDGLYKEARRLALNGLELKVPSMEFMVFFTFFHAWHHFLTTGVGWRQVSDLAIILHAYHGQLDLDKLYQWIDSMHLLNPWRTFGYLMVDNLGLPKDEMPFYKVPCRSRAQKLYDRIMVEGNFRRPNHFNHSKPKRSYMRKLHTFIGIFINFFQLASIFPDQAFREANTALKVGLQKKIKKNRKKCSRMN